MTRKKTEREELLAPHPEGVVDKRLLGRLLSGRLAIKEV